MHQLMRIREEGGRIIAMLHLKHLPPDAFLLSAFKRRFPDCVLEIRGRNDEHHKVTLVYPGIITDDAIGTFLRDVSVESVRLSMRDEELTPP